MPILDVKAAAAPTGGVTQATADPTDGGQNVHIAGGGVSFSGSLPAGTAVIGHVIVDSAGAVAVTSLPALTAGTAVIGHVIVDSASALAVTSLPALPAGANVIGHVIVDSSGLPTGAATEASLAALVAANHADLASLLTQETTTATKTTAIAAQLPSALGAGLATGALRVTQARDTRFGPTASIPAGGQQIVSGAGVLYYLSVVNTGIGTIFVIFFDATATPSAGAAYIAASASVNVGVVSSISLGSEGIPFTNGLWVDTSSTAGVAGYTPSIGTVTVQAEAIYKAG